MAISAEDSDIYRHTYGISSVALIYAVGSDKPTYGMSSMAKPAVDNNYRPTYGVSSVLISVVESDRPTYSTVCHQWQYLQ